MYAVYFYPCSSRCILQQAADVSRLKRSSTRNCLFQIMKQTSRTKHTSVDICLQYSLQFENDMPKPFPVHKSISTTFSEANKLLRAQCDFLPLRTGSVKFLHHLPYTLYP